MVSFAPGQVVKVEPERLLDMCMQFYDRQFLTREKDDSDVLAGFERQLNASYSTGLARKIGFPTVAWLADALHYSVGYFGDLIIPSTLQDCSRK